MIARFVANLAGVACGVLYGAGFALWIMWMFGG